MDTLEAMSVFVRVVERGSFSAVARELGTTQPTISKQISALEQRLGGRLIARSTRQLSLTDEGQRYYQQCRDILAAIDNAEHSFQTGREAVAGPLRVASSVSFGRLQLAPRLRGFLQVHPQVSVDLQLSDQNVDLLSEGVDVAIRIGELKDSNLIARQIGLTRRLTVASPAYLAQHPGPQTPEELAQHNCLLFTLLKQFDTWSFDDGRYSVQVRGNVHSNNSEAIREMVLSGLGISLSPSWLYREDIDAGQVVQILPNYTPSSLPIYAVFPANRRQSARVRAFVDFLAEAFAQDPDLRSNS
ncbi:LysR family transcriptional regulator [Pseudomonas sp. Bc-h]|jgi:DNA-binding transcriptional LysR family regulator|uniref:LysR family transcriptional regulator n=1 Tax=Pseudomonas sp. Bc-h TaxID=1943632 RepID=UPI0009D9E468|nr:LysR family transcriptional regulator [Pseudomonas sp. Bc-h]OQR28201.1 LysR family transcriptional regulator [Pseudomonas sp. Bc-h]